MKKSGVLAIATILIGVLFAFSSCEQTTSTELEETFQKVKEVTPIPGAQNVTMDLQQSSNQYGYNTVSLNGGSAMEAWCIEWNEPAINGVQKGTNLYSTKGQDAWKELNYFMRIKNKLLANDPDLTGKEIQVVIWSLIENPSFDVDKISEYENIPERIYKNGQSLFNVQKVKDILSTVKTNFAAVKAKSDYEEPGVTLVENDGQTIMVAGETAFAVKTKMVDGQKIVDSDYSTCFDEEIIEDTSFPNWGWTNGTITDPSGELTFDIYAGAGQCDLSKGSLVGHLTAEYSGGTLTVTYKMTETSSFTDELYTMATAHLYAGNDAYPTNGDGDFTVAPGQYTIVDDPISPMATEKTYTIPDLSGPIYFIAHADVIGFDPDADD